MSNQQKLTLVFSADSAADLKKQVADYLGAEPPVSVRAATTSAPVAEAPAPKPAKTAKPKPAPAEAARPAAPADEDPFATADAEAEGDEEETLTIASVTAQLEAVNSKVGVQAVREALASVGLKKVSAMTDDHLPGLSAFCTKALAGK